MISSALYSSSPSTSTGNGGSGRWFGIVDGKYGRSVETLKRLWILNDFGNCSLYAFGFITFVILYGSNRLLLSFFVGRFCLMLSTSNQAICPFLYSGAFDRFWS